MPNVAQGVTASYTFTASQIVSFTIDSGEQAVVNITRGGTLIANRPVVNNQVIGPYLSGDVMTITSLRGAVDYDVSNYSAPTPGGGTVDSASVQAALSSDQAGGRTALGLGTAATQASTAFLTPAQRPEVATWADLPAANSVTVGRTYTVLATGWRVYSDGTNWRPASGRIMIAQRGGLLSSPIATLTGSTAGTFILPAVPTLLAGMIAPHSTVHVRARVRRLTAAATASVVLRLGTAGDGSDNRIAAVSTSATANVDANPIGEAVFGASTTAYFTGMTTPFNGAATAAADDRATQVNTAATMFVSIGTLSANAADQFALISYAVWLEG